MPRYLKIAAVALAALVVGAGAAPGAGASTGSGRCSTGQLLTWLPDGRGDGTAGSIYYKLEFTNLSSSGCTLSGFPTISAVGLGGEAIGRPATDEPAEKARTIRLGPGDTAVAQLRIVDAEASSRSACHPTTAAGLRVRALGLKAARVVPLPFEACARGGSVLSVGPFRPGD